MDDYARGFDSGCGYMLEEMKRWREINPNKTLDDLIALLDSMENNERKPS